MIRRPPVTTRPDTHCPYAALFRSGVRPHIARRIAVEAGKPIENVAGQAEQYVERRRGPGVEIIEADEAVQPVAFVEQLEFLAQLLVAIDGRRSEERRVGKECVSTCRSRWSPDH